MDFLFNNNVCRVCMQNDKNNDLLNDKDLLDKFIFTTRLVVSENDNLPKVICVNCTVRLKVAHKFIKSAHESENNLKSFLSKINTEFKEVTHSNKSKSKSLKGENVTEDDILSLVEDEDQESNPNTKANSTVKINSENIIEKRKFVSIQEQSHKKIKADLAVNNTKQTNEVIQSKDALKEKKSPNSKKEKTAYHLTEDVLLIHADNSEIEFEDHTNFMEIQIQDEDRECVEEEERDGEEEEEDEEPEDSQNDDIIGINEESQQESQLTELPLDHSDENPNEGYLHEYETMLHNQVDTLQYQTDYVEENSVEEVIQIKEDSFYINNNLDEEDLDDDEDKKNDTIIKPITGNEHEEFLSKTLIKKESRIHRFYCEKCKRDFSTKTNLNRHMLSHEGNKPFACPECDKSYTQKSTLKQHMYTHTGERPYVCADCNRGFTQCKSLIFHMRRHTGEKPFHCEYCLLTFRQKDALRNHILKHHVIIEQFSEGNEMYTCIICQKKFDTKTKFKNHMKAHTANAETENIAEFITDDTDAFPFRKTKNRNDTTVFLMSPDSECLEATAVVNVSASSASEPSRAKKFQCRKCFKCFSLKKSLIRHMRIHTFNTDEGKSECVECDLQFSSTKDYQEHMLERHQYACSGCPDLIFQTIQDLKMHMMEHEFDQQEEQE